MNEPGLKNSLISDVTGHGPITNATTQLDSLFLILTPTNW